MYIIVHTKAATRAILLSIQSRNLQTTVQKCRKFNPYSVLVCQVKHDQIIIPKRRYKIADRKLVCEVYTKINSSSGFKSKIVDDLRCINSTKLITSNRFRQKRIQVMINHYLDLWIMTVT